MRKTTKGPCEEIVNDIQRATRKHCSSGEKIRIVLDGLAAQRASLSCVAVRGSRRASITSGPRTSWKLVCVCLLAGAKIANNYYPAPSPLRICSVDL